MQRLDACIFKLLKSILKGNEECHTGSVCLLVMGFPDFLSFEYPLFKDFLISGKSFPENIREISLQLVQLCLST